MASVPSVVIALVALLALVVPGITAAETIGPACWNMVIPAAAMEGPSSSAFVPLFTSVSQSTDPDVPSTATVVGVNRTGGPGFPPPVSGTALESAGLVSMGLTVAPSPGRGPLFVNVQFLLSALNGEGHCTGGSTTCGEGKEIVWVAVPCQSVE